MWAIRKTGVTVCTLLLGVALVAIAVALVVILAPDGVRDLRAYAAAPRCPVAPHAPAECRWTQQFTVASVHVAHKKNDSDSAVLIDAHGRGWATTFNAPGLNELHEGDRVSGTVWRGRITEITAKAAVLRTNLYPANWRVRSFFGALVILPSGLLTTAACVWRLRRRRNAPTPVMDAMLVMAYLLPFVGLFSALPVGVLSLSGVLSPDESFWPLAVVWLPAAALLTLWVCRSVRRRTWNTVVLSSAPKPVSRRPRRGARA